MRAIAALLVFLHHFNNDSIAPAASGILQQLHIGVTVFFVLSGFLICFRYYDNVEISGTWFGRYMRNRVARIYPVYLLLTIATFIYAALAHLPDSNPIYGASSHHYSILFLNLTFLKGFSVAHYFTGIAQAWSLTVEECFYFLAPLFFILVRQSRMALFYLPALIITIGFSLVYLSQQFHWPFYEDFTFMLWYTFTGRCCEFFMGIALALIILKKEAGESKWPLFTLSGIVGIIICLAILAQLPPSGLSLFPDGRYSVTGTLANNILLPLAVTLLFYGLLQERSFIRKVLSSKLLVALGRSSYVFYLIHIGFISLFVDHYLSHACSGFLSRIDDSSLGDYVSTTWLYWAILYITLNLISFAIYSLIEEPMNRLLKTGSFNKANK